MKIDSLETLLPDARAQLEPLVIVRVTAGGLTGCADTFYAPSTVAEFIHEFAAPLLLGEDASDIERLWEILYVSTAKFGGRGAELRGLSALDIALWDIAGKAAGKSVASLLTATPTQTVPVYNTCAGRVYATTQHPGTGRDDSVGLDGPAAVWEHPAEVAASLVLDGYTGMKIWPFDRFARASHNSPISDSEIEQVRSRLQAIRDSVGDAIEVMIEGHGFWSIDAAIKIVDATREFGIYWFEDLVLGDDVRRASALRRATVGNQLAAGESLATRMQYFPFVRRGLVDFALIDPSWCGGITEAVRIVDLAASFGVPTAMHDCTGPFNLLAGLQVSASHSPSPLQEVVRPYLQNTYRELTDLDVTVKQGAIRVPDRPGLGGELNEDVLNWPKTVVRRTELRSRTRIALGSNGRR